MAKKKAEKTTGNVRAHTRYRLADNTIVPGVTTITGILNKPALVKWANNLGLQGIDSSSFVDEKAKIGTLAHEMLMHYFRGTTPDLSDATPNQIELAENSVLSYYEWEKGHDVEPILVEQKFVSEKYRYGGALDLYAKVDGTLSLVDFKTGKGIFKEMGIQLAGYKNLLEENGHKVKNAIILNIGRGEDEAFQAKPFPTLVPHWKTFRYLREVYDLMKVL